MRQAGRPGSSTATGSCSRSQARSAARSTPTRPARALAEPPRTLPARTDARSALQFCLSGPRERCYDDLVLLDDARACAGIVRVTDLLQEATGASTAA